MSFKSYINFPYIIITGRGSVCYSFKNQALFIMAFGLRGRGQINRFEGGLLCCAFIGYETWLYLVATA